MKVVVRIAAKNSAKAWALLVRHSPGMALPDRTFIVSEGAVRALREAGIKVTEISRDGVALSGQGVPAGERI